MPIRGKSPISAEEIIKKQSTTVANEIRAAAERAHNEAEFRTAVARTIENLAEEMDLRLSLREEYTLLDSGRADAVYNRFIIEYEPPGSLRTLNSYRNNEHAIGQVKQYIEGLHKVERHKLERIAGVAFDRGQVNRLRTIFADTRNIAFDFLKSKNTVVTDNDVRANIFFPEYDSPTDPKQYKLKICPGLHLKMDYPPELNICFQPNQGATGNVFVSGLARVAQRLISGTGDWDDLYNITDDLAETIHPDLKWIISMPLQVAGGKPMGVVNVDGLRCQFPNDILYECMFKLTTNVMVMSNVLASR